MITKSHAGCILVGFLLLMGCRSTRDSYTYLEPYNLFNINDNNFDSFSGSKIKVSRNNYFKIYKFVEVEDLHNDCSTYYAIGIAQSSKNTWSGRLLVNRYSTNTLVEHFDRALSYEEAVDFVKLMDYTEFFSLPISQPNNLCEKSDVHLIGTLITLDGETDCVRDVSTSLPAKSVSDYLCKIKKNEPTGQP
jgi:hypothetical protein